MAILITAGLAALVPFLDQPPAAWTAVSGSLLVGTLLFGIVLGLVRSLQGTVLASAGVMAGWLYLERVIGRAQLGVFVPDSDWISWLCPGGDFRQGPAVWVVLLCAAGFLGWRLRRGAAPLAAEGPALPAELKWLLPLSVMSFLAPLDLWLRCLWSARLAVGWRYLPRLLGTLAFSLANTLLSLPERVLLPRLLRRPVPDPIFVVGTHRSGTTHLHNLLALDPQFVAPRNYQVLNPVGFLFSGWLWAPLLTLILPRKRPMDNMDFSLFTAQEEEFALGNLCPARRTGAESSLARGQPMTASSTRASFPHRNVGPGRVTCVSSSASWSSGMASNPCSRTRTTRPA